jgi:hypothetical protein
MPANILPDTRYCAIRRSGTDEYLDMCLVSNRIDALQTQIRSNQQSRTWKQLNTIAPVVAIAAVQMVERIELDLPAEAQK